MTICAIAKLPLQEGVDKLTTEFENLEKSYISLQDSLQSVKKQIVLLENELNNYKIHKSFFKNEITIITGIFIALIAIAVFIIGFLLPRILERKQQQEFIELKNNFTSIRDKYIENSVKETVYNMACYVKA